VNSTLANLPKTAYLHEAPWQSMLNPNKPQYQALRATPVKAANLYNKETKQQQKNNTQQEQQQEASQSASNQAADSSKMDIVENAEATNNATKQNKQKQKQQQSKKQQYQQQQQNVAPERVLAKQPIDNLKKRKEDRTLERRTLQKKDNKKPASNE